MIIQKRHCSLLTLLPFALSFACSGGGDAQVADVAGVDADVADAPAGTSSVLASADLGYGVVKFHESVMSDGTIVGGVSEELPGYVGESPVARAFAEGHTSLEVFLALLPEREPPQSLVDAHATQAAELGRSADVQVPVIELDVKVEKNLTQCKNHVTPASIGRTNYTYSGTQSVDDVRGTVSLTLPATTLRATAGVCNEPTNPNGTVRSTSHTVRGRVMYAASGSSSWTNPGFTNAIAPGASWVWHGLYVSGTCTVIPPNTFCIPPNRNVSWRVEGKADTSNANNTFDLLIARIASSVYVGP